MSLKKKFKCISIGLFLSINILAATFPFSSIEEFEAWEINLKRNATFNPNYKVPDYMRVGASSLSSSESRYYFFKSNPQYLSDYENIHKGQLSTQTIDGTSLIKSKYENMPADIAAYYKEHPAELLAAEGFGFDPVLARKLYTGEIKLPSGTNNTQWLRENAWTPEGIVPKNNVVAYANAAYSGNYVQNKIDPTTGKIIDSTDSTGTGTTGTQVTSQLEVLNSLQKEIATIIKKAKMVRSSIELTLATNDLGIANVNCEAPENTIFAGRCKELVKHINDYNTFSAKEESLKSLISSIDSSIMFKKIALDLTPVKSKQVTKRTGDIFEADKSTPDCTAAVQKGWKCLTTKITTLEGNSYNILLKWNRPNLKSKGSIFYGVGGTGMDDSLVDPNFKISTEQLDQLDSIRTVSLQMLDARTEHPEQGGYWIHGGGYETLAQIFMAVYEVAIDKGIMHGNFSNYQGGSNGTMLLASAMSRYNADIFFDRVVFQAGPFLPSLKTACDPKSSSSFELSNAQQKSIIHNYLSHWMYLDASKKVCDDTTHNRLSLLSSSFKKDYPYTKIHVIMGQKESTEGFGNWILASDLEWFNSITANSKERIVRTNMGHHYSYEDVRRFLKLAPNETPDRTLEQCITSPSEVEPGKTLSCGCGNVEGGVLQENGCFLK